MYNIIFTKDAEKSIKKLSEEVKRDLKSYIIQLAEYADIISHKKLKGNYYADMYKLRIGNYRVIYSIDKRNMVIIIEFAGHRKNIYKIF